MKPLQPQDLADLHPTKPHGLFVEPFLGDGFTPGGIFVAFNERLYPVLARVLCAANGSPWDIGAVVVHQPFAYDWVHLPDGRSFGTMDDRAVLAVVRGFDTNLEPEIVPAPGYVLLDPIREEADRTDGLAVVRHRDIPRAAHGSVTAVGAGCVPLAGERVVYLERKALVLVVGMVARHLLAAKYVLGTVEDAA